MIEPRILEVRTRIIKKNDELARAMRERFTAFREGTSLAAADLRIVDVPVRVWCPTCTAEVDLPDISRLSCPRCGTCTGDIRAGRELELESIELEAA